MNSPTGTTAPQPLSNLDQVATRIEQLQQSLQTQSPNYEGLLHQIHTALIKDPDVAILLSEEQIGIICAGLSKKKNIVIAEPTKKGATGAGGKKLKDLSLGDL